MAKPNSQRLNEVLQGTHYTNFAWTMVPFKGSDGQNLHQAIFWFDGAPLATSYNLYPNEVAAREEAAALALPFVTAALRKKYGRP